MIDPFDRDDDLVHRAQRGQPMRHTKDCAVFAQLVDGRLPPRPQPWSRARRWPRRATRIGALRTKARAMARRWRWPPDSVTPRSPMRVSYPSGNAVMNSCACACLGRRLDLLLRVQPAWPSAMFSATVKSNNTTSWLTSAICSRNPLILKPRRSCPSSFTVPASGS